MVSGSKIFFFCIQRKRYFCNIIQPEISKHGNLQFIHPDFDKITEEESNNFLNTGKIIPFYRIPNELKKGYIGDLSLRRIINYAVENYVNYLDETLPAEIVKKNDLLSITKAVRFYHFPDDKNLFEAARQRFKFEELFYLEILVALRKHNYQTKLLGNKMNIKTNLVSDFIKTLPFELTKSQLAILSEIKNDMLSDKPMNRLLQGDVGSGKTIVSLIAALIAVDNGFQAALMVPTEILAGQHAKSISVMMKILFSSYKEKHVKVSLLIGGQKKTEREKNLSDIELNEADIIIGTHALFEKTVKFNNLGLVVIDEQHRFGVKQRSLLQSKGKTPDVLVMSATPIPRTLSMTVYGDLDVSVIDEMPKNRKPIKTVLRGESKLPEIYKFINDKCKEDYQTFIVYPLVEESEKLDLKAAIEYYDQLKETYLNELQIGLIHGKMKWQDKEEVMLRFLKKEFDVLISTTVIEVGIDIPNANIILINDAHRFGLSQLHQLRGRVGRSDKQSYCILVTKNEIVSKQKQGELELDYLSTTQLEKYKATVRLQTMVKSNDGFKVAEIDLKLRGPGNIFGTEQSGFPDLKYADLTEDYELIFKTKKIAFELIKKDPKLLLPDNKIIKENLVSHYSDNLKYARTA
jgi:ATP-dependent DNA helicase RecG